MAPLVFSWRPFPYGYFALFLTCILIPLSIRIHRRRVFFVPLLLLTWRLMYDAQAGYITSTVWFTTLMMASDYILLTDVQRELRQLDDAVDEHTPRPYKIQKIEHASLIRRIVWASQLLINTRGVGWAHEPRSAIPPGAPPKTSRAKFVARQVVGLCGALLLFDLANLHIRWNPAHSQRMGLASVGYAHRVVGTVGWGVLAASGLSLPHYIASIVAIALGISRPQDWPPLFGSLADAATVRTFWARGWHQVLRRSLSSHGKLVSNRVLGFPRRSIETLCVRILVAFMLSGLVHYLSETMPIGWGCSGSLIFFSIQPVAILLETTVELIARRADLKLPDLARRVLGHVWVLGWFALTLPIMQDPLIRAGEMDSKVEVSLIRGVWTGEWIQPAAVGASNGL
ncbi:membrane bound O-acyl transferase family-domain-containing protein [Mycena crocata]|nr:membrane bound O-acyl transferase family-domain-containing protein [Mycena crocata]